MQRIIHTNSIDTKMKTSSSHFIVAKTILERAYMNPFFLTK